MKSLDTRGTMVLLLPTEGDEIMTNSETIRAIRKATGLSQAAFGIRFGIPRRTIQDWEAGRMTCPAYVAELLAFAAQTDYHTPRLTEEEEHKMIDVKDFDAAVALMDDEIREELHREMAPCTEEEFLRAYEKKHLEKYGEPFTI